MDRLSLSIFFGYHDSCVTVADNNTILLHLEAERYFREKHCRIMDGMKMDRLVSEALSYVGGDIGSVERVYVAQLSSPLDKDHVEINGRRFRHINTTHHMNHIGTVLDHGFDKTLIVVADGGSEDGSTRLYLQNTNSELTMLEDLDHTAANGRFYGSLTMLVIEPDYMRAHGWDSGKTMGLSAYGKYRKSFEEHLRSHVPQMLWGSTLDVEASRSLFDISDDYSKPWLEEARRDLAHTGQLYWTKCFREKLEKYRHLSDSILVVGGCAFNVLLNSELIDSGLFKRIHVGPASGDSGQSLGAILFHERNVCCNGPYLGRGFGDVDQLPDSLVTDLLAGRLVAWYQGRSEIGPRALGHRSLLGLPNSIEQRDRMNRLKGREPYRPVAPIIIAESLEQFFATKQPSPFMSFAPKARESTCALAPAIVHADGTSRVQTLSAVDNPILYEALTLIGQETGIPMLMNTSFNFAGEPMVDTPDDALRSFKLSGMDVLYINGERIEK